MRSLLQSRGFVTGFSCGVLAFVAANIYSYEQHRGLLPCYDCVLKYGFPLPLYRYNGAFVVDGVLWEGLIIDVLLALSVGLAAGFVCDRLSNARSRYV